MTFLDEQGVGPCGHAAKDKGILMKVYSSCLSHEIPRQLADSAIGCENDEDTGDLIFIKMCSNISLYATITDAQHGRGINFTQVRCGQQSLHDQCLCSPEDDWKKWSSSERTYVIEDMDRGRKTWNVLLLVDDDETVLEFVEKTQGENSGKHLLNLTDYGTVLESQGEDPKDDEAQSMPWPSGAFMSSQMFTVFPDF